MSKKEAKSLNLDIENAARAASKRRTYIYHQLINNEGLTEEEASIRLDQEPDLWLSELTEAAPKLLNRAESLHKYSDLLKEGLWYLAMRLFYAHDQVELINRLADIIIHSPPSGDDFNRLYKAALEHGHVEFAQKLINARNRKANIKKVLPAGHGRDIVRNWQEGTFDNYKDVIKDCRLFLFDDKRKKDKAVIKAVEKVLIESTTAAKKLVDEDPDMADYLGDYIDPSYVENDE